MKKDRVWLLLFILIAFALRLLWLGEQSLWYDEGVTWMLSQMPLPELIRWTAADIQPPLYYLLIWATDILIDDSEWALRFPSTVFNILTLPLIYIVGRRLFPTAANRIFPLLVVFIFSLSPLMIFYSQEARMYTLLVFQVTLASYLLLRIFHAKKPAGLLFVLVYALTATAALYTHYFAAFLLMAHALYIAVILWRRWSKSLFRHTLQMFGLTLLLFVPWLPVLFSRLGDDPSYWPGALKLDEALRKVFITFGVGETTVEQTGLTLTLVYLALLILAGIWEMVIWEMARKSGQTKEPNQPSPDPISTLQPQTFFLLILWLSLPILLILALSYQSPKFNPRYTMLAYPAFIFLLAAAITRIQAHLRDALRSAPDALGPISSHLILSLILLFILTTSSYSLYNWFTDSRFSKDDFQALAQFVRERSAEDETVLLSSGHMFPVWAYYAGWNDNWTPLPWMQRLDVNRVTDLSIAAELAEALEGKGGAWLVTWQDEVIDPNGVVPFWLDLIGERPIDAGDFWGVGLEHWRIEPDKLALLDQEAIDQPTVFNFANRVDLIGSTQLSNNDLALFWRARQPLPDDLIITLDLTDSDGHDWDRKTLTGRPGAYFYPPSRWPVGEIVMTRHQLPWQLGTPPGLYIAEVGLGQTSASAEGATANAATDFIGWDILNEQGHPQRRTALLNFINLSHLVQPTDGPLPIAKDPQVDFLPIIALRRSILPEKTAEPGDRLLLGLVWQAGEFNLDDVSVAFDLIDASGNTFRVGSSYTPSRRYNLPRWTPGEVVLGQYWLDIPSEAAPGPAALQLHLINVSGFFYDEVFPFDDLEILPTERNFTPPDTIDISLDVDFSEQANLIGLDCRGSETPACRAAPGQALTLTLYWHAKTSLDKNYTVFTHLLAPDETVLVNADHAPPKPTQGWVANEIIADPVTLAIPADVPPGHYTIEIGLYDAADPTFPRLPSSNGETRVLLPDVVEVD